MIPAIEQQLPCRTAPKLFHSPDGRDYDTNAKHARVARAKALCKSCPIVRECRQYARETREPRGIWGGETAAERRMALAKTPAPKPTPAPEPTPREDAEPGTERKQRRPIEHGTRAGYQRHRRNGEEACDPCRHANSAADRRLHQTGSTLAAA